jgi:uncharacterized protein YyaL (SSP411 family)
MDQQNRSKPAEKIHNKLIFEKSPYLLQHAYNPVDWHSWNLEAFEKARTENKPIFLSIGYSTCHWCHVMAHESFEDPTVANLMNEVFISIKVDREERPDIDGIYMKFCQMMTGGGGWPLSIIMTPDKKPFFAATYIPKETRFGRIGMLDLIPRIKELWIAKPHEIERSANQIAASLEQLPRGMPGRELDKSDLDHTYYVLEKRFDERYGGFGTAPKFPTPHNLFFLLRYWKHTGNKTALELAEKTLLAIRRGGIYDQLGFGVHRYSTDSHWLVPHFEKMLYDQALLSMAYTEAYQATGKDEYAKVACEIFDYILRDMTSPEGGFYSAEDADSEGEEGKFYLWTLEEIQEALTKEEADFAVQVYNINEAGNFAEESTGISRGKNILHLAKSFEAFSLDLGISEEELQSRLEQIRKKLFMYRKKRIHPLKDDKILTDWNGLMIAALAKGAQAFDESKYIEAAIGAADFILDNMRSSDGRLIHRFRDGQAALPSHVDDYAFLTWGLLELYEAVFDVRYLQAAIDLSEDLIAHFWDKNDGGFYFTAEDAEDLILRQKEIYDGAIPSGNSVAMSNLLRIGRMTANSDFEEKSALIGKIFSENIGESPLSHVQFMVAAYFAIGPSFEIVIVGDSQVKSTKDMLRAIRKRFIPSKVVILRPTEVDSSDIDHLAGFVKYCKSIGDAATAYVCTDYSCKLPTTDISKMLEFLEAR